MKRLTCVLSLVLAGFVIVHARDAAALKTDLASIMPVGKTAVHLAWIRGGGFTEFAWDAAAGGQMVVYAAGSEDGVIRRLYPATGSGQFCNVSVAANGQRVFFDNRATGRLCVINWDGTGFKEINVGGDMWEYWCNPADGSDWVVVNKSGMSRVKVDAPGTSVQICGGDYGGDGCGLSDDGKTFFGYTYDQSSVAFSTCDATTFKWTFGPHGGCQGSLSGGASPKYNHNPSGHSQMCVHDMKNQTQFTVYATSNATSTWLTQIGQKLTTCQDFVSNEGARFTQDPNFATYCISQSKVNPILVRLPDLKMIYMDDNLACTFCGDMDAVFLPPTVPTSVKPVSTAVNSHRVTGVTEAYSLDGRRLDPGRLKARNRSGAAVQGVVISRDASAVSARVQAGID